MQHSAVVIAGAVEGPIDEAVVRRLIVHAGAIPGAMYGKKGKHHLRQNIKRYNEAARHSGWIVLVDLDHEADCAPSLRAAWLPSPAPTLCLRVAVRAVETWLFADRQHLSLFLGIPPARIPHNLEAIGDPKALMVTLASRSRRREVREDMVPRPHSGRKVGPVYTTRLIEFVEDTTYGWHPDIAVQSSDSLERCLRCLQRLVRGQ